MNANEKKKVDYACKTISVDLSEGVRLVLKGYERVLHLFSLVLWIIPNTFL
jgi:hypothetical protein